MTNRRITKEMAKQAAEDMKNAVYKEKLNAAKEALNKEIDIFVKGYFPAPVLACVAEYKEFIKNYNNIILHVHKKRLSDGSYAGGYYSIYGVLSIDIPAQDDCWSSDTINVSERECRNVVKANAVYEGIEDESISFFSKVENALLSLKTEKRVTEQFPEALPYLKFPDDKSNLPSPIFSDIRAMLQSVTNNKQ